MICQLSISLWFSVPPYSFLHVLPSFCPFSTYPGMREVLQRWPCCNLMAISLHISTLKLSYSQVLYDAKIVGQVWFYLLFSFFKFAWSFWQDVWRDLLFSSCHYAEATQKSFFPLLMVILQGLHFFLHLSYVFSGAKNDRENLQIHNIIRSREH